MATDTTNHFRAKKIATIALLSVSAFVILFLFLREVFETEEPPVPFGERFSGDYHDANHPNCVRHIQVLDDGIHAYVFGTDGDPGCPQDGSGVAWRLDGTIRDADTIVVDFSPKDGPTDLEGKRTGTGILWEDQNVWTEKLRPDQTWSPAASPFHQPVPTPETFAPTETFPPTFAITTRPPIPSPSRAPTNAPSDTWPPSIEITIEKQPDPTIAPVSPSMTPTNAPSDTWPPTTPVDDRK